MTVTRRLFCLILALWGALLPLARTPAADRGIGGTGAPAAPGISSDRGIGGTGIVGVITGFGSVKVNGLEIAYAPDTPVTIDGMTDTAGALQVGQMAAIAASDDHGWQATTIAVHHEVFGPVTAVTDNGDPGGRVLTVAGQHVAIGNDTLGLTSAHPGDWVAVSGLRQPDGVIAATRIDLGTPGTVLVRGPAVVSATGWQIGDLPVRPPEGSHVTADQGVTVRGEILDGTLVAAEATPDVLRSDPAAYFGTGVHRWVIESYVSGADGQMRLGHGLMVAPGPGIAVPTAAHRAIVEFERGPHGGFVATGLRGPAGAFGPHLAPFAPGGRGVSGPGHHGAFAPHRGERRFFRPRGFRRNFRGFRHPGFGHGGPMRRRFGGFRRFGRGRSPHFYRRR